MVKLKKKLEPQVPDELEKRRRIQVALWAYAYEVEDDSLVPDHVYDMKCREIDLSKSTGDAEMDKWFRENFDPSTGVWVHKHPGIKRLAEIYRNIRGKK